MSGVCDVFFFLHVVLYAVNQVSIEFLSGIKEHSNIVIIMRIHI